MDRIHERPITLTPEDFWRLRALEAAVRVAELEAHLAAEVAKRRNVDARRAKDAFMDHLQIPRGVAYTAEDETYTLRPVTSEGTAAIQTPPQ